LGRGGPHPDGRQHVPGPVEIGAVSLVVIHVDAAGRGCGKPIGGSGRRRRDVRAGWNAGNGYRPLPYLLHDVADFPCGNPVRFPCSLEGTDFFQGGVYLCALFMDIEANRTANWGILESPGRLEAKLEDPHFPVDCIEGRVRLLDLRRGQGLPGGNCGCGGHNRFRSFLLRRFSGCCRAFPGCRSLRDGGRRLDGLPGGRDHPGLPGPLEGVGGGSEKDEDPRRQGQLPLDERGNCGRGPASCGKTPRKIAEIRVPVQHVGSPGEVLFSITADRLQASLPQGFSHGLGPDEPAVKGFHESGGGRFGQVRGGSHIVPCPRLHKAGSQSPETKAGGALGAAPRWTSIDENQGRQGLLLCHGRKPTRLEFSVGQEKTALGRVGNLVLGVACKVEQVELGQVGSKKPAGSVPAPQAHRHPGSRGLAQFFLYADSFRSNRR